MAEIESYRGSVISFSGDAITCWFDDANGSLPLRTSSNRQRSGHPGAMQQFAQVDIPGAGIVSLAIKVVVTAGSARRFLIGDPAIQLVDALAGKPFIDWMMASTWPARRSAAGSIRGRRPGAADRTLGVARRLGQRGTICRGERT